MTRKPFEANTRQELTGFTLDPKAPPPPSLAEIFKTSCAEARKFIELFRKNNNWFSQEFHTGHAIETIIHARTDDHDSSCPFIADPGLQKEILEAIARYMDGEGETIEI